MCYGWHQTRSGKYRQAAEAFDRAASLRPGENFIQNGRWRLGVLTEDWEMARAVARDMSAARDTYWRWRGLVSQARTKLFRGRSRDALALLAEATRTYREPDAFAAMSRAWTAEVLLQTGRPELALEAAEGARKTGEGQWPERYGLFLSALASAQIGRKAEAGRKLRLLEGMVKFPNPVEERLGHHLAGLLAMERHDVPRARHEFRSALRLLPPRGIPSHWHAPPDHVPLWYSSAQAEWQGGAPRRAAEWLERVTASGVEHVEHPVLYVRSFYELAKIRQDEGRSEEARELYRRFAGFWRDGDMDRDHVEDALSHLAR